MESLNCVSSDRQTDTQNLFCPKPYKTKTKKYNARKKTRKHRTTLKFINQDAF